MTMKSVSLSQLSSDPIQTGCWWLSVPHGEVMAEWVDILAETAQKRWPGRVAVLDTAATLISNLRVWENLILPVWRRDNVPLSVLEESVAAVFDIAQIPQAQRERLSMRLPAMLDRGERRLVVLLRSVLIESACVIIEEDLWHDLTSRQQDLPAGRLFARLQEVECLIVVGSTPAPAGFVSVDIS